jgi:hypothetical protein
MAHPNAAGAGEGWKRRSWDCRSGCALRRLGHIPNTTSHNLVAEWQTWMKMHGAPGHILFVGNGAHAYRPTDLPETFQAAVAREFPGTLAEPLRWS